MQKTTTRLVTMAFLIALEVILTRFLSISLPIARIGIGFLPVAVMGIMYGPIYAGIGYALGDLIGVFMFSGNTFFPGFTLTAFLTGITYGLILYKKTPSWPRTIVAALCVIVLYTIFLNTFWLSIMFGKGYLALLPTRLVQAAIMLPVQVILIRLVWQQALCRLPNTQSA